MRPVTLASGGLSKDDLSPDSVKNLPEVLESNVKEGQAGAEELPVVGARDLVVDFPPYSTAPVVQDVTTTAQCFTPRAANWMRKGDGGASGDNCRLESIGISKTIIASNFSGMNITFVVPFISSMSSRPSTTWTRSPPEIKSSGRSFATTSERKATLTIQRVRGRDCSRYICRLRDSVSEVKVDFKLSPGRSSFPPRGPAQVT